MARTGRPRHAIPRIKWDVYVRPDLAAKVELIVQDPMRPTKAKYGARSAYLEALIEKDLAERAKAARQQVDSEHRICEHGRDAFAEDCGMCDAAGTNWARVP